MEHATPRFVAKAFSSAKYLPLLLLFPALFLLAFLGALGDLTFPSGEIVLGHFVSVNHIFIMIGVIIVLVLPVAVIALSRFWRNIIGFETVPAAETRGSLLGSFISSLVEIMKHSNFSKCGTSRIRYFAHLGIFYGFILLMLAAFIGAIYHFSGIDSPYPLTGPVKIAGNLGTLLIFGGLILAIFARFSQDDTVGKTTYSDWFLLGILFFTAISGLATEVLRLVGLATATYSVYLVHLWLIFTLFLYVLSNKVAHIFYQTLAMTYAKQIGRKATE